MENSRKHAFVLTCHLCDFEGKALGSHLQNEHGAASSGGKGASAMRITNAILHADEVAAVRAVRAALAGETPGRIHPDDRIFAGVLCAPREGRWPLVRNLGLNTQTASNIFSLHDAGELPRRELIVCA